MTDAIARSINLEHAFKGDVRDDRSPGSDVTSDPKMWLFVRSDLPVPLEKLLAQAGHAATTCALNEFRFGSATLVDHWLSTGQAKITKRVRSEAELRKVFELCSQSGIRAAVVTDAARTFFPEPTVTMAAVGPCLRSELPKFVERLQVLKRADILALQPEQTAAD